MRDQIMSAVDTKLRQILVTNGYATDLGNHVFSWRLSAIPDTERPAVAFRDVSREITQHVAAHLYKLTIEFEAFPLSTSTDPAGDIRLFIQDVVKAVGTDVTWGGLAIDTVVTGDSVQLDAAGTAIKSGLITAIITYRGGEFSE